MASGEVGGLPFSARALRTALASAAASWWRRGDAQEAPAIPADDAASDVERLHRKIEQLAACGLVSAVVLIHPSDEPCDMVDTPPQAQP